MDPDSRARTLLANERTFLALIRTGPNMVAIGLAAAQFIGREEVNGIHVVTIFSLFLAGSGVLMSILGGTQFVQARNKINAGTYQSGTSAVGLTLAVAVIAGLIGIGIILFLRQPL